MSKRDEFPVSVRRLLAERAGQICSNPDCRFGTTGPHTAPNKSTRLGKASHICAAAPGGPRYDPEQSPDQRRSIENGIWLCGTCADLVDADERRYPRELLQKWRADHEQDIQEGLKGSRQLIEETHGTVKEIAEALKSPALRNLTDREMAEKRKFKSQFPIDDRILQLLYSKPNRWWSLTSISMGIGLRISSLQRVSRNDMIRYVGAGLVDVERRISGDTYRISPKGRSYLAKGPTG
ncbi:MAG: hypothetical protein ABIP48_02600 [Planctomycetota bacterium]